MVHGRPGPAPQTAKREQFAPLIGRGVPNAEACRLVDINRRTRTRWPFGRSITGSSGRRLHYSAVVSTRKREISPRYLSVTRCAAGFPGEPERHVVHETIYQAIYRPELGGLRRDLPGVLRTGRRRRRPHRRPDARRASSPVAMTMIGQRPAEADDRAVPGHWEGDLITGAGNRSAIGTLVERASRFTILLHLPGGRHTAEAVRDALVQAMGRCLRSCAVR
jgi:IS30 family transposase